MFYKNEGITHLLKFPVESDVVDPCAIVSIVLTEVHCQALH